ncbi:hypothetical protein KQX54_017795 [Cotesia glomerata]|uniref:Uncharacterized protein n=1 Tax=Cotesia glomerata TaxID=32391 RepID=A0AAV7IJ36_COTGL|nr:hypothetical protein KQX54_017795 [Cotesia glomerata]
MIKNKFLHQQWKTKLTVESRQIIRTSRSLRYKTLANAKSLCLWSTCGNPRSAECCTPMEVLGNQNRRIKLSICDKEKSKQLFSGYPKHGGVQVVEEMS